MRFSIFVAIWVAACLQAVSSNPMPKRPNSNKGPAGSSVGVGIGVGENVASVFWQNGPRVIVNETYVIAKPVSIEISKPASTENSKPVSTEKGEQRFRIGIIADLDKESLSSSLKWTSYLRRGNLLLQYRKDKPELSKVSVEWVDGEPSIAIESGINEDGRGMELSELFAFNGKLYSCDDRTGIVYELRRDDGDQVTPVPWVILADGNGTIGKGFKCEWGTVRGDRLLIGGLGKEWTTPTGELVNHNPQFVKSISREGQVRHHDWKVPYQKLAAALDITFPGYVIHEAGGWSEVLQKYVFLPRRASKDRYNDKTDESKGTNIMLIADSGFTNVEVRHVGEVIPTHGFSSFKWIPGTGDNLIIALKSEEFGERTASYVMVFDMQGNVILPEVKVGDMKYEGIEFL